MQSICTKLATLLLSDLLVVPTEYLQKEKDVFNEEIVLLSSLYNLVFIKYSFRIHVLAFHIYSQLTFHC